MSEHSETKLKGLASKVLVYLSKRYPKPKGNLHAETPWQLLVATILSAQCTDERVNSTTPAFFSRWNDASALAEAEVHEIEEMIRSVGLFRSKAKNLLATSRRVRDVYHGEPPSTLEDLMTLPGVARKTANVVLFGAYGINEGFAVDTHVKRISYRLGLTNSTNPVAVEKDLMRLFPREEWGNLNHRMVWFGRELCRARSPVCTDCGLVGSCARRLKRCESNLSSIP